MAVPYHLLKVCGNIIFAAQGSDIHSFNFDLGHISTWKYPVSQADESRTLSQETKESPAPEGPPAKRRRVEDGQDSARAAESTNGQEKSTNGAQEASPANEKPFIQGLYATNDGGHLVAVTGSDKTIWAFEHDGAGNLKQLSQRAMPKRPSSLALTTDSRTILSADKFGDVYALPLIPSASPCDHPTAAGLDPKSRSATPSSSIASPAPFKPQANEFTVHTKRNLRALENQKLSLNRGQNRQQQQQQQQRPQFEHTLLLGHVSMITAICVGTTATARSVGGDGSSSSDEVREYIITADRDEHIRVSRGMPQAHVIEGFCLGHEDFVSRLCVAPGGKTDILISGGGDDDLFVWEWARERLLGRTPVLEHVKGVVESATKVAVTRVFACRWGGEEEKEEEGSTAVFVVVERVPALFCYELLQDNALRYRETIRLPGNPLDVEATRAYGQALRLLVAIDNSSPAEGNTSSLIVLHRQDAEEGGWRQSDVRSLPAARDVDMSAEELQKTLYTTENLRKLSDFE